MRITAPQHPLHGALVPVVRRLRKGGEAQLVIRRPNGHTQLIPERWTLPPPVADGLWSADSLRMLVRLVASLHAAPPTEAADDRPPAPRPLADLQPADPAATGDRLGRAAPAAAPGRADTGERRGR